VGLAEPRVEFERAARGPLARLVAFERGHRAEDARPVVEVRQLGVRERVTGVERDRFLERRERLRQRLIGELAPEVATAQVSLVRLRVPRAALAEAAALVGRESRHERRGDLLGDGVFEFEHVREALVEAFGPARRVPLDVEELDGHADALADAADVAVEHVSDAQRAPGVERPGVLKTEHGAGRAQDEAADFREARDERVGQADL
jgi:hypothetical protein